MIIFKNIIFVLLEFIFSIWTKPSIYLGQSR